MGKGNQKDTAAAKKKGAAAAGKKMAGARAAKGGKSAAGAASKKKDTAAKTKTTAARSTGAAVRETPGTPVRKPREIDVPDIRRAPGTPVYAEAILWIVLALCVILFISNILGIGGIIGNGVSRFFFGAFGVLAYTVPILLFFATAFLVANRGSGAAWIKTGASFLLFICCCSFCELLTSQFDAGRTFADYYETGSELRAGGGVAGGLLCRLFCPVFGQIGAWVCLLVLVVIAVVMITERSLFDNLRGRGSRAYQRARRDSAAKREMHSLKKEKNQLQKRRKIQDEIDRLKTDQEARPLDVRVPRREHKVTGVIMDTRFDASLPRAQEIHEVMPRVHRPGQEPPTELPKPDIQAVREDVSVRRPAQEPRPSQMAQPEPSFTIERNGVTESVGMPAFSAAEKELDNRPDDVLKMPDTTPPHVIRMPEIAAAPETKSAVGPETRPETDAGADSAGNSAAEEPTEHEDAPAERVPEVMPQPGAGARQLKNPRSSREEQEKAVDHVAAEIAQSEKEEKPAYIFPPLDLLQKPSGGSTGNNEEVKETAMKLQQTLHNFGVNVTVTNVSCGPTVTRYELTPEQGVKVSRIVNLSDDIKLNLAAADIRIEAPIPGKSAVGIEVPNRKNSAVLLRELLDSDEFRNAKSNLSFAVGKDIAGKVVVADIAKMPHLLIAGATGSGKSVCINTLIMSILYKADPEDVKLIMIDPKVVELSVYNGIPHLFIPVVTDPKKASGALNWGVAEMTDRYQKFAEAGVRDLKGYNEKVAALADIEDENKPKKLPQIVIIVDELADLMMVAPGEVEDAICRLAQLARAAGIHLIIATQRPSVNVITGLIKANMPSRIAFSVSSGVDSRTIIDMNGAEKLLGKGDMLFYPQGYQKPARMQGAFVSDREVADVTAFLTQQGDTAENRQKMEERITQVQQAATGVPGAAGASGDRDANFAEAGKFIIEKDKASIGMLQRVFKIGFNRAARIMDQLADAGVVGPEEGTKPRKILMTMEEFDRYLEENV